MRRAIALGLTIAAVVLGGCATANTPQQNLAFDRWATCGPAGATLQNVALDGRVTFIFSSGSAKDEAERCLAQPSPDGSRLPVPIAVHPAGGV